MILTDESDHSECASFSVGESALVKFPEQVPRSMGHLSRRRRVYFNEDCNECYENKELCHEEYRETWYSDEDYIEFRSVARETIRRCSASRSQLPELLEAMYDVANSVDFVLDDASRIVTPELEQALAMLFCDDNRDDDDEHRTSRSRLEMIGLEYQVCKPVNRNLKACRESIQEVVRDIQAEMDRGLWTPETVGAELRDSCRNFTQVNSLLAQFLAKARAMAC